MTRICYALPVQALTPNFGTKTWSSTKIQDSSINSLDGLAKAFTDASKSKYPQAFPEHEFTMFIYGLVDGNRVYDIKYFASQGVVASHGRYHTGPAFSRSVSTLDELIDAFVDAKAAMVEAFPSTESSTTVHREAYFSSVSLWSSAKSAAKAVVKSSTNAPTTQSAPVEEPEIESDGPPATDIFGNDDDW